MSRSALGPILLTMCEDKRQALIDELYRGSDGAKLLAEVFAETLPEQASILMAGLPATVIAQVCAVLVVQLAIELVFHFVEACG